MGRSLDRSPDLDHPGPFDLLHRGIPIVLLSLLLINVSATDYGYGAPKPPQYEKPEIPKVEKPSLDQLYGKLLPQDICGIQGLVYCTSGHKKFPIQGAVARITCLGKDENGYETAPFSILSGKTDAKGYFFATLSLSKIQSKYSKNWKLTKCNAFLDSSPWEGCKVPTDVNRGITGAPLTYYRTLNAKNMKLFSVAPFYYTTSEPKSTPPPTGY